MRMKNLRMKTMRIPRRRILDASGMKKYGLSKRKRLW
jgi:hypothetical protein